MFKKLFIAFACLALSLIFMTFLYAYPDSMHQDRYIAPMSLQEKRWVDSIMSKLSERDRIAQLFMVAAYSNLGDKHVQNIKIGIEKYKIGGLIFFQGTPEKQAELTNMYQSLSTVPLLVAMDAEWGVGMRLDGVASFPRQMTLGAIADNRLLYEMGAEMARQCQLLGVHINFAPSVDVNNNAENPVINVRSFGENQYRVAEKGIAIMAGMQDNNVIACAKHFPGHGDTDRDSHNELPEVKHSRARLDTLELEPFREMINKGIAMVMVGHLHVSSYDTKDDRPASISKNVIQNLLKNKMEFKGLVISDALNMKGVKQHASGENVSVAALKAGNDILLMPDNIGDNIAAIEEAIKNKELSQAIIDESCRKVLVTKYRAGLNKYKPVEVRGLLKKINSVEAAVLKTKMMESAITLVGNQNNILPLKNLEKYRIGYLAVGGLKAGETFGKQLSMYAKITAVGIPRNPNKQDLDSAQKKLAQCDVVIVGYHTTDARPQRNFGIDPNAINFVNKLSKEKAILFNFFGTPYFLSRIGAPAPLFNAIVVAYDNSDESQNCAAQMLFGGLPYAGKLPVTPLRQYPAGYGIETYSPIRLAYVRPEEIGIQRSALGGVDSLAKELIARKGAPGCQIVAVYKGKVFYQETFGAQSYEKGAPKVQLSDVYDVASVTKVSATLPLVMKMIDQEKIKLHTPLKKCIQLCEGSNKGNIEIEDLLLHQAGLQAWMPFHLQYFTVPGGGNVFSNKPSSVYNVQIPGTRRYIHQQYTLDPTYFSNKKTSLFDQQVAANLYTSRKLREAIYLQIDTSKLQSKTYRYSDLGFIYLQRVIEAVYQKDEDELSQEFFYAPLGMYNTGYLPMRRTENKCLVPTEDDKIFRRQLLKGTVHDQAAALFGGVSGHAGLFSNANDLAKLYQMYLNKGVYGGERYLSEETITTFTSSVKKDSRRGLGFDKQEFDPKKKSPVGKEPSLASYGHTGFTGTMVWVDPEHDLVYVFLSNRVNPIAENKVLLNLDTRNKILSHFIKVIDGLKPQK